ncbi:helix-turn-helix domain-containing protein [Gracilibacillus sp. YIM 98692]|uniref:helix-turn-helix domain-containing protein n=1 Tax=Gracilibacillus sp. YIM 98692 TaxID=2663532 RepID=UPI0013D51756|nr:helix-turn-helix domain-containing protein [Gracilibacillus sp. YIM 98692]
MQEYLTTNEVVGILGLHKETVLRYAREGKLKTVPDHPTFPIRKQKLFYKEDVFTFKEKQKKKGLTVSEVAEQLNVTNVMVHHYIKEGKIKGEKEDFRSLGRYLIQPEEVQEFLQKENRAATATTTKYYKTKQNVYLFQPYVQTGSQNLARVIELSKESIWLLTEDGERLTHDTAKEQHFKPIQSLVNKPYIQKKGKLTFSFPYQTDINHRLYDVIDWLMKELGYKNMQVKKIGSTIKILVRSTFIKSHNHIDFAEILKEYCQSGTVELHPNGILLDSDYQYISAYVPSDIKEWIEKQSQEKGISQSDFIEDCLRKAKTKE